MRTSNSDSPPPQPMESESPDELRSDPPYFDHWTSLISETETTFPDDLDKICAVYDSFLCEFPLCHGYWRRYADHKLRLCGIDKVVEVFERAVQSATYCVPLWVDYCNFGVAVFEDPSDIRRLFKRGLSFVGKDYSCYSLWDKYIEFEYSQQQWSFLAQIYIQALRFPTRKLHLYYESLKKLAALFEEEMKRQSSSPVELKPENVLDSEVPTFHRDEEISLVVKDLLDAEIGLGRPKALQRYIYIGKQFYDEACRLDRKIGMFENNIKRPYFHVKQLDAGQLENWHQYLDFVEIQRDFDWAVKLYERCLIPCANYPEIWMRYVEFMETNGGREIANYALDRVTEIFLKRVSVIHLFSARFKEQIGDVSGVHDAFLQCNTESDSQFVKNVTLKANMEKRMGNSTAASNIYKEAIELAAEKKKLQTLPILYVQFSRLTYMMADSADAARDILVDGITHLPHCKSLLEELINLAIMHGGKQHLSVVESIVANAISDGLNAKDAEDISSLYLEFVDLCGTIQEVRKVWNRHVRLFPHSTRAACFDQQVTFAKPIKLARGTEESLVSMPLQPSGDFSSESLIELSLHDEKMLYPESPNIDAGQDLTDHISDPGEISEQKLPSPELPLEQTICDKLQSDSREPANMQEMVKLSSPEASREQCSEEAYLASVDLEKGKQVSPEVSEQPRENTPEPKASTVESGCQIAQGNESLESLREDTNRSDTHTEWNNKSEEDLKPLSVESLCLNPQEDTNVDSTASIPIKCEASQETCTSRSLESNCKSNEDSSMYSSRNAGTLHASDNQVVNSPTQVLSQPAVNSYGDWHQDDRPGKIRRDSKFGFRGGSQRKSYQQQPFSPQKYPRAQMGGPGNQCQAQMGGPVSGHQCQPSQFMPSQSPQMHQGRQDHNPYQAANIASNVMVPNAWPMQSVQPPNYASSSQPQLPVQSVAPQTSQPSILGSGEHAMQNSQAYNQMWQYYYCQQQQQFFLQQQLQLDQQEPQQHQALLQQYQQQLQQYYAQMQQQQPYQQHQFQQLQAQHTLQQQLPLQQQQYNQQWQMQQQQLQGQQHLSYAQDNQQPLQQQLLMQQQQQQQNSPPMTQQDYYHHQDQAAVPANNPDGSGVSPPTPVESLQN